MSGSEIRGSARRNEKGSALLLAVFVLVLLTGTGAVLLFASRTDVRMSVADQRAKKTFYFAESGIEVARENLRIANVASADPMRWSDELDIAAGGNDNLEFAPGSLTVSYDSAGNVTSLSGFGDDVPVAPLTSIPGGWYAAFLTNDPAEGAAVKTDANERLLLTAVGAGASRSLEVVQAIVERIAIPQLPSTITILGPSGTFDGGSSNAKRYNGNDCAGSSTFTGISGYHKPVVGTTDPVTQSNAVAGVRKPSSYTSGSDTGTATVQNVSASLSPLWQDCSFLQELTDAARAAADYICTSSSTCTHWASTTMQTITFVNGNLLSSASDTIHGHGILFVTGDVEFQGNDSWDGMILVIGTGNFARGGGGNGETYGGTIVANISGPDGILGTADDCTGGTSGFSAATYTVDGNGTHDSVFCSDAINQASLGLPLKVVSFRQR